MVHIQDIEEDPNAKWEHALSLEDTKLWQDRQNELDFMKDLFNHKLPIDETAKPEIEEYFNRLQEAIFTKDENFKYDEFPTDYSTIDVDGAVAKPPTQYKYFSQDLFKQQASEQFRLDDSSATSTAIGFGGGEDMETASNLIKAELPHSDGLELSTDYTSLEECPDSPESCLNFDGSNSSW